ncbi:MAG: L-2-hydroxyglutarate oxidase [Acidobacteria bacterium]|nr:L-2-hydroxyglutarate oxidase [Acidobacteriota bacterium]
MVNVSTQQDYDIAIIGAGIVGLATATSMRRKRPDLSLVVLEKETGPATHQTGRNSGVIHSGLYYTPGSRKAAMVASGRRALFEFCDEHDITYELCGKVVVAVDDSEIPRLDDLHARSLDNDVACEILDGDALREREPAAAGVKALHVPSAGIIDYRAVSKAHVEALLAHGHDARLGWSVDDITTTTGQITLSGPSGSIRARVVVNCAGLHSDRIAAMAGADLDGVRIMPFRGEYFEIDPARQELCHDLIYPLPDPAFPFLGVHLTRMIRGGIHAGPNAVPALQREGYRWRDIDRRDLSEVIRARSSWVLARKYWRTGLGEIHRSLSKRAFVKALSRLVPDIRADDLKPSPSGVRAQAIGRSGSLLDDFEIRRSAHAVHVLNAPSPAATASLAIGDHVADLAIATGEPD